MSASSLLSRILPREPRARPHVRPAVENLEGRSLPSTVSTLAAGRQVVVRHEKSEVVTYYDVGGTTPDEIRADLNQLGPVFSGDQIRYDSKTEWRVDYRYTSDQRNGSYRVASVSVRLAIETVLPRWTRHPGASPETARRWDKYVAALAYHERTHAKNGRDASAELRQRAAAGITARTPAELQSKLTQVFDRILAKTAQRDVNYDQATRHGATQGATFP